MKLSDLTPDESYVLLESLKQPNHFVPVTCVVKNCRKFERLSAFSDHTRRRYVYTACQKLEHKGLGIVTREDDGLLWFRACPESILSLIHEELEEKGLV